LPIYEYKCEGCGETFEVIQKFADEPVTVHAKCGGHVHRLMSAPSFQFKGSGWYVTDYAKGGGAPKNELGKGDSGKGDSGKGESSKSESSSKTSETTTTAETKTESKPAATSDKSKSD
jgi:putative FmdB family regulatory protein